MMASNDATPPRRGGQGGRRWPSILGLSLVAGFIVTLHLIITFIRDVINYRFVGVDNVYTVFGLWSETSLANWYSSTLALICAALLAIIALIKRRQSDRYAWHWAGLAFLLFAVAVDDAADAHGQLSFILHHRYQTDGVFLYAWAIPALMFVALMGLVYARFLWNLAPEYRWRIALAGALFCASAVGLELLEGRHDSLHGVENLTYKAMVTVEETVEMAALIFFIATLLTMLRTLAPTIRVRLEQ